MSNTAASNGYPNELKNHNDPRVGGIKSIWIELNLAICIVLNKSMNIQYFKNNYL